MAERAALISVTQIGEVNWVPQIDFSFVIDGESIDSNHFSSTAIDSNASITSSDFQFLITEKTPFWRQYLGLTSTFFSLLFLLIAALVYGAQQTPEMLPKQVTTAAIAPTISKEKMSMATQQLTAFIPTSKNRFFKQNTEELKPIRSSKPTIVAPPESSPSEEQRSVVSPGEVETNTLKSAIQRAHTEQKLTMIKFGADWCMPCKLMNKTVLQDPEVKRTMQHSYVYLDINIDDFDGYNLKQQYRVQQVPTVIILDNRGRVIDRHDGAMGTSQLLELLQTHDPKKGRNYLSEQQTTGNNPHYTLAD